jgi:hypothetical protein
MTPLCIYPIRTSAVIRLPDVEKSWKSHVPSRAMFCQKVKIIDQKTDMNCMNNYTDRGVTPGQGSTRVAFLCHNIMNIIMHMTVSSIRDSDALMSVYRTDIAQEPSSHGSWFFWANRSESPLFCGHIDRHEPNAH